MKLRIVDYDYTHLKYLTSAENTSDPLDVKGAIGIYPIAMKITGSVLGTLDDITTYWGGAVVDSPNYIQIPKGASVQLTFQNAGNALGDIGSFSDGVTSSFMGVIAQGEGAASKFDITFNHINPSPTPPTEYIVSPNVTQTPGTTVTYLTPDVSIGSGFDLKLYLESKLVITNTSSASEWIRIYEVVFHIQDTVKSGVQTKRIIGRFYRSQVGEAIAFRAPREIIHLMSESTKEITGWDGDNVFASSHGYPYNRWIDSVSGSVRNNGKNSDDSIQSPVYMIESLLRDENFVERDLQITTKTDTTHVIVTGLKLSEDDFYNYAIYYNVTRNFKTYITDYVGSTKSLTLAAADTNVAAGDNIYLTNVQGDLKIDFASFDVVGNTTNGLRGTTAAEWIFARSYGEKQNIRDILDELCFESHCELIESVNPVTGSNSFKLIALDPGTGDTWTNPAYVGGSEQITTNLTPLENVFTQFRLRYFYDYGKGDFTKEIYADKNGVSSTATILGDTEKNLCKYAEQAYGVSKLFEYASQNIYDDATAEYFLQKKIKWFTKQRLEVNYLTPITGNSDWIKYEVGDQVKLNFSQGIPTGLNNSAMFMITDKNITPLLGGGFIRWQLIEIG